jgi:hypothetical protein
VDLSGESHEITGNAAVQLQIVTQFRSVREDSATAADAEDVAAGQLDPKSRRHFNAPMYIVSSADKAHGYWPALAAKSPERVVLGMILRSAKASAQRLLAWMQSADPMTEAAESAAIAEVMTGDGVLSKCDVILKVNRALLNKDPEVGPSFASLTIYANTPASEASPSNLVVRYVEQRLGITTCPGLKLTCGSIFLYCGAGKRRAQCTLCRRRCLTSSAARLATPQCSSGIVAPAGRSASSGARACSSRPVLPC